MPEDEAHTLITQIVAEIAGPPASGGIPAVDIADLRSLMLDAGPALYGCGEACGDGRATRAAELAIADIKRQLVAASGEPR